MHPNQELFEPEEIKPRSVGFRIFAAAFGLVAILGMLYLSGVYQIFFLQKTPSNIAQEPIANIIEGPEIVVPLNVVVIQKKEAGGSDRSNREILNMVENASNVWHQAKIKLVAEKIEKLEVSQEELTFYKDGLRELLIYSTEEGEKAGLPKSDTIDVYFVRTLRGLNGVAFGGTYTVAVADFTSSFDYRVLAHEVGHILGLGHTADKTLLMNSGGRGVALTKEEAIISRDIASRFWLTD